METISFKLPPALQSLLEAEARRRQTTKSKLIRDCLEQMLRPGNAASVSCHDLAQDLAGSLRGPRDLATNKKYLKGFGR
jgi:predicted transcriptional regulator